MNSRYREGGKMDNVNILIEALKNIASWELKGEERISKDMAKVAIKALVDYRDWEWIEKSGDRNGKL